MESLDTSHLDGRVTRWTAHREQRRHELTQAAIAAIRTHGATVGMDEIATQAGTSKTVIYRHLGDRLGLYLAVCEAVDAQIMADLNTALAATGDSPSRTLAGGDPEAVLVAVIDAYLHLVESDPEVYRFVVRRPLLDVPPQDDPVVGLTDAIAETLDQIFTAALTSAGRDPAPARTWAHGLIGFVREAADRWLSTADRPPREVVVKQLADFTAFGLTGVLRGQPPDSRDDKE